MHSSWLAIWVWAELGEVGTEVLLKNFEAEVLTMALEHLGQSWGATEENLCLALLLCGHFLECLGSTVLGESRGRGGTVDPPSDTAPGADNIMRGQQWLSVCPHDKLQGTAVWLQGRESNRGHLLTP